LRIGESLDMVRDEDGRMSLKDIQKREKRKNSMGKKTKRRKRAQQERTKEEDSRVE